MKYECFNIYMCMKVLDLKLKCIYIECLSETNVELFSKMICKYKIVLLL